MLWCCGAVVSTIGTQIAEWGLHRLCLVSQRSKPSACFLELLYLVCQHSQFAMAPGIGRKTGLIAQVTQELFWQGKLFPHLRQKGGSMPPVLDDHAVDLGTK